MLPRRSRKKFTSDCASSTSDSLTGNPPLNVATITGIPEVESPESSPQSQKAPPVPDRSPPPLPDRPTPPLPDRYRQLVFPHPPHGIGGFRRPSTRCDTHETFTSAPKKHAPTSPQSPSMPLPQIPEHPPAQIYQQQPGQGGGAGGPVAATPFHRGTANYTYRLDSIPPARPNLNSPQHKPTACIPRGNYGTPPSHRLLPTDVL